MSVSAENVFFGGGGWSCVLNFCLLEIVLWFSEFVLCLFAVCFSLWSFSVSIWCHLCVSEVILYTFFMLLNVSLGHLMSLRLSCVFMVSFCVSWSSSTVTFAAEIE